MRLFRSKKSKHMNLKTKIFVLVGYFFMLFILDFILRKDDIVEKLTLYGKVIAESVVVYSVLFIFSCLMIKNPLSSKKILEKIFRILIIVLFISIVVYGGYYIIYGFSELPFIMSAMYCVLLVGLEKLDVGLDE